MTFCIPTLRILVSSLHYKRPADNKFSASTGSRCRTFCFMRSPCRQATSQKRSAPLRDWSLAHELDKAWGAAENAHGQSGAGCWSLDVFRALGAWVSAEVWLVLKGLRPSPCDSICCHHGKAPFPRAAACPAAERRSFKTCSEEFRITASASSS